MRSSNVQMTFLAIALIVSLLHGISLDVTSLFDFSAGLVAFFFVVVCVLIFIFIYDNLRRQKEKTAPTTV